MTEHMARAKYQFRVDRGWVLSTSWDDLDDELRGNVCAETQAALRALRNPTEAMLAAPNTAHLISRVGRVAFLQAWRGAIDAAIGESK